MTVGRFPVGRLVPRDCHSTEYDGGLTGVSVFGVMSLAGSLGGATGGFAEALESAQRTLLECRTKSGGGAVFFFLNFAHGSTICPVGAILACNTSVPGGIADAKL